MLKSTSEVLKIRSMLDSWSSHYCLDGEGAEEEMRIKDMESFPASPFTCSDREMDTFRAVDITSASFQIFFRASRRANP